MLVAKVAGGEGQGAAQRTVSALQNGKAVGMCGTTMCILLSKLFLHQGMARTANLFKKEDLPVRSHNMLGIDGPLISVCD